MRKLPKNRTGTVAITTDDPNTLNSNVPSITDGHGISGDQCLLSLMIGALGSAVTITVWAWFEVGGLDNASHYPGFWVRLGAGSSQYSKSFDSKTIDGFSLPEKTIYYLQGSANVTDAWVDGLEEPHRARAGGTV